jgi:hypothetical protein
MWPGSSPAGLTVRAVFKEEGESPFVGLLQVEPV